GGHITATPKRGWSNTDVAGPIGAALGVPVAFETDVGAAAAGEQRWGATTDVATSCYVTIGTGIGGACIVDGAVQHGMAHAEMGHQRIPHDWTADPFAGSCPFHGDCWEGLASGLGRYRLSGIETKPYRKTETMALSEPTSGRTPCRR